LKNLRLVLLSFILLGTVFCALKIYKQETQKRILKQDLIELSKVKYGLFSVDQWKLILADIITRKVEEFDLEDTNRAEMHKRISGFLSQVINDFEDKYHKDNSGSVGGWFKSGVASFTNLFGEMKKNIPSFTDQILDFMEDPENREDLRQYIIAKLNSYADNTFSQTDYSTHDEIIDRYETKERESTITALKKKIGSSDTQIKPYAISILLLLLGSILYLLLTKIKRNEEYLLLTFVSLCFLLFGLLLPMIDIDARIASMRFTLLGESIAFYDQVLYFKSKSILEVVQLMLSQGKLDLLLVGILVLSFSVLFPLSKLLASVIYVYGIKLKQNKLIRFLVFRTGKWSMADVMVIAIFMSYIGFTGIITEQLKQIENISRDMDILTTNQSSLQIGFFLFTSFVILSLLIAHKLQYRIKKHEIQAE
jgi:hypothetical protein